MTRDSNVNTWRVASALSVLVAYVRAYPGRAPQRSSAVLVAGLMDGLGMSMLLSMLSLATRKPDHQPSLPEQVATRAAEFFGLPPTAPVLLSLAIVLISLKAVLALLANRQVGYTVAHIATELRLALVRAVMAARWRHYLQQSIGRLSNAVATEAQRASEAFQHGAEMAAMLLNSLIYLGIALSISWQAGVAALVAGTLLLVLLQRLIRISRRAGQHQTTLLRALVSAIGAALAAAKPLKAMAREDHIDALISDQTRQLKRAIRRQVISKEALTALQEPCCDHGRARLLPQPVPAADAARRGAGHGVPAGPGGELPVEGAARLPAGGGARERLLVADRGDRRGRAQVEPRGGRPCRTGRIDPLRRRRFSHGDARRLLDHASSPSRRRV
jgi:ATP-binding cassette subfamily C protein